MTDGQAFWLIFTLLTIGAIAIWAIGSIIVQRWKLVSKQIDDEMDRILRRPRD